MHSKIVALNVKIKPYWVFGEELLEHGFRAFYSVEAAITQVFHELILIDPQESFPGLVFFVKINSAAKIPSQNACS